MTPEERAEVLVERWQSVDPHARVLIPHARLGLERDVTDTIRAAVEAAVEACAMMAVDKAEQYRGEPWERVPHAHTILIEIAAAIRARQEPR